MKSRFAALVVVMGLMGISPVLAGTVAYNFSGIISLTSGTDTPDLDGSSFTISLEIDTSHPGGGIYVGPFLSSSLTIIGGASAGGYSVTRLLIAENVSFDAISLELNPFILANDLLGFGFKFPMVTWSGNTPDTPIGVGPSDIVQADLLWADALGPGANNTNYDLDVASTSVSVVPEPTTLTLLLGGLGVLGIGLSRKP